MSDALLGLPVLSDDVVRLRAWFAGDVPVMVAAFSDPWFVRFNDWAPTTTVAANEYLATVERRRREGTQLEVAIAAAGADGAVLGGASLHDVDRHAGRAAVGYWLAPQARGQGAASRAVRLLASWAFSKLGLVRVELTCGPDNVASQGVAERCGFYREGVLRSHIPFRGGRRDSVMFSLLPGELI